MIEAGEQVLGVRAAHIAYDPRREVPTAAPRAARVRHEGRVAPSREQRAERSGPEVLIRPHRSAVDREDQRERWFAFGHGQEPADRQSVRRLPRHAGPRPDARADQVRPFMGRVHDRPIGPDLIHDDHLRWPGRRLQHQREVIVDGCSGDEEDAARVFRRPALRGRAGLRVDVQHHRVQVADADRQESLLVPPRESGHVDVRRHHPHDVAVDRVHQQQLAGHDESIAAERFDDRQPGAVRRAVDPAELDVALQERSVESGRQVDDHESRAVPRALTRSRPRRWPRSDRARTSSPPRRSARVDRRERPLPSRRRSCRDPVACRPARSVDSTSGIHAGISSEAAMVPEPTASDCSASSPATTTRIRVPSGDHACCSATPSTAGSGCASPIASAVNRYSWCRPAMARSDRNVSVPPSGDHRGWSSSWGPFVTCRRSEPSTPTRQIRPSG